MMRTKPSEVKKRERNRGLEMRYTVTCHRCGEYSGATCTMNTHHAPPGGRRGNRCRYTTQQFYQDVFSQEVYDVCFNHEVAGIGNEEADEWAKTIFYDPEREDQGGPTGQVYVYVKERDGVFVPTYIGVTTAWKKRDEADYKKLPEETRVVVVDNVPEWICESIESCLLYRLVRFVVVEWLDINKTPPEDRVIRNDNHMHAQLIIPPWLREMASDGHTTMEGVFVFLRTESLRMMKGALGATAPRLSKELWLTPAQEADRNKSLSTPVNRRLSYTPMEVEEDFEMLAARYFDKADERGTFPDEERRSMVIQADGSVLRAANDEEQAIFDEAVRTVWLSREASRIKNNSEEEGGVTEK